MKNTIMASRFGLFSTTFFIILVATMNNHPVGASKEFKVGDSDGWRQPGQKDSAMYNHWAARNRFHVGDSLSFQYKNDSVVVVDKWGYYHCNTSNPISTFNNGNSVVNLDKPGPIYFISGDPDHCNKGQRLVIQVMTLHSVSDSPPSSTPPQPYLAESPSPLSSSSSGGVSVSSVTLISSVSMALASTFVGLLFVVMLL